MKKQTKPQARQPIQKIANEVWAYILGYYQDKGYMPTLGEIAQAFSTNREKTYSIEWVRYVLRELESQGKIRVEHYKHRGIQLI